MPRGSSPDRISEDASSTSALSRSRSHSRNPPHPPSLKQRKPLKKPKRPPQTRHTKDRTRTASASQSVSRSRASQDDLVDETRSTQEQTPIKNMFSDLGLTRKDFEGFVFNVRIGKTDPLVADAMVLHPVVRVHVIDASTGRYVKKSASIPATTFNESESIDFILPVMTRPFSFQKHQSTAASWNEDILIICEYLSILSESTIVFFEILDFGSVGNVNETEDGWRRVAWAFIKLIAGDGQTNTEKEQRLQLFEFSHQQPLYAVAHHLISHSSISKTQRRSVDDTPFVFQCWASGKRVKYPSTLYVDIRGKPCPEPHFVKTRPTNAIEIELGKLTYEQLMDEYLSKRTFMEEPVLKISSKPKWRRLPGQSCKIPKKLHFVIDSAQGSFACSFSSSGIYLAISCFGANAEYQVKIYDAVKGDKIVNIDGHQNLVYDIKWASEIDVFATASSDSTVRVYKANSNHSFEQIAAFYHPSFTYTVAFHSSFISNHLIATGCADGLVRIWKLEAIRAHHHNHIMHHVQNQMRPLLSCYGHSGTVNAVLFDGEGVRMYSADSCGSVRIWACNGGSIVEETGKEVPFSAECIKVIPMDHPVRSLSINPHGRKVLIFLENNELHALDTRIFRLMTKFTGMPHTFKRATIPAQTPSYSSPTTTTSPTRSAFSATSATSPATPTTPTTKARNAASAATTSNTSPSPPSHAILARAIFSPCGTHVYASTTDGRVFTWKAETGALMYVYTLHGVSRQVVDIAFHPKDHYVAFSTWGQGNGRSGYQPLCVYTWDERQDDALDGRISLAARDVAGLGHAVDRLSVAMDKRRSEAGSRNAIGDARKVSLSVEDVGRKKSAIVDPQIRALRNAADLMMRKLSTSKANEVPGRAAGAKIIGYKGEGHVSVID
ncbi:WD40-repeat-containing domain protein [Chytriomyces cf. hyalinus JEL632]|nr:WD40-repeat-containing domain protein [Chytriomyces cf. hyalinus JEL632]